MPEPFNVRRKQIHREMNKTDHDTAIIKPPLQQYNDPRLDHPCPSVLNKFYRKNGSSFLSEEMRRKTMDNRAQIPYL
jgi:hypothetical protein